MDDLGILSAEGYTLVKASELFSLDRELTAYTVPTSRGAAIRPEGLDTAVELEPTLRYYPVRDQFTRIADGVVFTDNDKGSFTARRARSSSPAGRRTSGSPTSTRSSTTRSFATRSSASSSGRSSSRSWRC